MTGLRERNKSKRRHAILDATLALLRERDFADVTVEEIAADAEVSPHTVYNLVGTRDDLIVALLGRVSAHMARTAPTFDARLADPTEPLRAVLDHAVDALLAEPVAYRQIMRIAMSLTEWPEASRTPPKLIADAVHFLESHDVLAPGVTPRGVARHVYVGFGGWALSWAVGTTSDHQLRDRVHTNLSLILASTTTGDVHQRAAAHVTKELR